MDQSREHLGVLANELKTLIPDAVTEGVSQCKACSFPLQSYLTIYTIFCVEVIT